APPPGYGAQPPGPTAPGYGPGPAVGYGGPQPSPTQAAPSPQQKKKGGRGLLIALLVGIFLLVVVGTAIGAYFVFFSSGGARSIAQSMPRDCQLLVELPSVRKFVLDLHDVQFLDTSLRDDKKVFDDAADSISKAFDITPSDATSLLVSSETLGISARKLEATPEGVLALGMRDGAPVETLLKSARFATAGAVGQSGQRYLLTKKVLPPSAGQSVVLKTLAEAELSATGKEELVWFARQKVLAFGSAPLLADLAQVLEAGAASIEQNPAYMAAKKDFDADARVTAFVDPGALPGITDPKVKALIDGYFTPAGSLTGSFRVKPAGFVSSITLHVTGAKLPRQSAYEPPQALNLAEKLPAETFGYVALSTRSKLTGAEAETLMLDQIGSLDPHARAQTEQGLRQVEQLLGVSATKLFEGIGGQAVLGVAASADTAIDQLSSGPAAAAHFNLTWVQELKDDTEFKKLAAQLKLKILPGLREVVLTDAAPGFALAPRGSPLPISLRVKFLDKHLFVTAGSNALGDRAEAAFSKGERTLKDDAAHKAAFAALPDTAHFRLWIDSGRVLDVLLKNPLLKARLVEQGLSLDKITLTGPNRVVSALSVRSEVQTEIWTYRVDALNFQALAPLGAGAAVLAGGLSGLPAL
ncbi:MAG TPA: hypothetical protein VNW92_06540, partial [Polyangiaceae bacterium]|nr:hypothetical protein [Polyangiaceae bacterium]